MTGKAEPKATKTQAIETLDRLLVTESIGKRIIVRILSVFLRLDSSRRAYRTEKFSG
ncbi:MAG: hypothetical protein NTV29_17640 [Planctomycetota bacterium]|nr:hypothetical protein [Planctomycetota bacterium]